MTPAKKMVDVNKKYNLWREKIMKQEYKWVRCIECSTHLVHDFNVIQRHMMSHHIKGRNINQDLGWKFVPTTL